MEFKIIELEEVYHVGTLNPADLGRNSGTGSLEGNCLSVSLCPHAWIEIARLGGYDTHKLSKPGGRFLDVLHILNTPALKEAVIDWAVQDGLASRKIVQRVWSYDDEAESWSYMLAATLQEAIEEINIDDDFDPNAEGPEGHSLVEPVEIVSGTAALWAAAGAKLPPSDDAIDLVIVAYAARCAPEVTEGPIDGVWWDETYDPDMLSAPRGGILPDRVDGWTAMSCSLDEVEDITGSLDEISISDALNL